MTENHQIANLRVEKRVLVVVNHPLGGIRTYLLNNLAEIAKSGYTYTFMAPTGGAFEDFKTDVRDWPGVDFIDIPVRNRKHSISRAVWRALKTRRFDLIHSQGLRAGTETALPNLWFHVPHIMTLHDVIVPQNDMPGRLKWLKQFITGRLTKRIDVIVPVSNDCAENHLQKFPCWRHGPCKIEVIQNGVDLSRLCAQAEPGSATTSLRTQIGINGDSFLAGFFGRFMPQKGFLVLLDALKIIAARGYGDKFRLVATNDPYGYGREYHRVIDNDPELRKMVHFIEPVTDIGSVLPQVDLLVMPSLWEACPLLPMEAMVLGVPVIGSDAIGLREVLANTPALSPEAGNAMTLADAIVASIDLPIKQSAKDFHAPAVRRFDNLQRTLQLQDIYRRAVLN